MNKFVNLCQSEVKAPVSDVAKFIEFLKCFKGLKKTLHVADQHRPRSGLWLHPQDRRRELPLFIDKSLDIDFVYSVFKKFGDLRFVFDFMNNVISLNAVGRKFEFGVGQQKPVEFDNLDKLFDHFNEIDMEELDNLQSDYGMDFESDFDDPNDDLDEMLC